MTLLSFVLPCYGSEKTIEFVMNEIRSKVAENSKYEYEIIAVNDCSPDKVWDVLLSIAKKDNHIKLINFSKNMNRPGAVMAGLAHTQGDIVIVMDDDGQCPMDRLWDLITPLSEGYDVSMASYEDHKQSLFKDFGTYVNRRMTEIILDKPKGMQFTNFMAVKRFIVEEILRYPNPYPYMTGLILRSTQRIVNVPMEERERHGGQSNFTFKKMLNLWMNGLTAFSVKPLRLATFMGVACAGIGFLYGLFIIIRRLFSSSIAAGYSSILAAILFIGGLIMLMLGIIGEYVGRIYISINKSPQYVIKETVNMTPDRSKEVDDK